MKLLLTTTLVTLVAQTFAAVTTITPKSATCNFLDKNQNPPSYLSMFASYPYSLSTASTATYLDLPLRLANVNAACGNLTSATKSYNSIKCPYDPNANDTTPYDIYQYYGQVLQDYIALCTATTKPAVQACIGIVFNSTVNACSTTDIPLASSDTGCALIDDFAVCVKNQLLTKCKNYAPAVSASNAIKNLLYSYNDDCYPAYYY